VKLSGTPAPGEDQVRNGNLTQLCGGLELDAEELAERLQYGDNESVLAWFRLKYPDPINRVVRERRWGEFLSVVRQLYEHDRDA